ncbi:hypothetical protein [Marivirga atlantica]|jgi:hypothetical protein|uniref:Phosphate-selective porin O and P n=1 Tax=Marivirga atlantica TaxID=1548457 RepID=A0A937AGH3_9BACT|nr:hypothetical protein [Marivirga atlantica]MBL0766034.1 hypothetical protein [Marivirga atlantica]
MKTLKNSILVLLLVMLSLSVKAQNQRNLQFFRPVGQAGLNVFETGKADTIPYEGVKVRVGGDFAMQFQALNQSNDLDSLVELGSNLNLPTANFNLDVQLYDGVRMHLRTYLSARHHEESWVKGGYLQMDKLDFIKDGFMEGFMDIATITIGLDEFNYGDAHFRRSDNARAIYNPFVGNYIMDAFSTEAFGDLTIQTNGIIGVIGLTNGKLNQNVVVNDNTDNKVSFFGKLGYDNQLNDDLRLRLTGSWYMNNGTTTGTWLYGGDRAGARYYNVLHTLAEGGSDFEPRINARFTKLTAIQVNPFIKFKGLEFFGIYEVASNGDDAGGAFTQTAAELLYRFGSNENFYLGGRYNNVTGKNVDAAQEKSTSRINVGAGWFLTNNILTKLEYVNQSYSGDGWNNTKYAGAEFSGINIEACISF